MAKEGRPEGTVVTTSNQSAGRGKQGAVWFSKFPGSLTFSVILRPRINADEIAAITSIGARALQKLLKDKYQLTAQIKLPNDVLIGEKKICGILTERARDNLGEGFVVMGMGVNVNLAPSDFLADLAQSATSLQIELGQAVDFDSFFNDLLLSLDNAYAEYLAKRC